MNRIIKFRAWDKINKKMCSPFELEDITYTRDDDGVHFGNSFHALDLDNYDIMRFTGLTDKNGVDIYEDDILKWYYKDYEKPCITPVKYYINYASFDIPKDNGEIIENEVIGNIHENLELLNNE